MPEVLSFFLLLLLVAVQVTSLGSTSKNVASENHVLGKIGAIIDPSCRIGKEAKIAMEMVVEDFHHSNGSKLSIHMRDSHGNPLQDASTIVSLVEEEQVLAVVGSLTWQEAAMIINASRKTMDVPILSFVTSPITQPTMHKRRPPIIQLATDVSMQMKCISAIIESHGWRRVIAIHENSAYSDNSGIINRLSDSLGAVGAEIEQSSALPHFDTVEDPRAAVREELDKLRRRQCKIFILLQSSLPMVRLLFAEAKQLGMMWKGYVWIINDPVTSLLDLLGSTLISTSMQGVIGIKTHVSPTTKDLNKFSARFERRFQSEYPEELNKQPGIYALRSYDAVHAIARSISSMAKLSERILLSSDFTGFSGQIHLQNGRLESAPIFQIVNIVGKSYREMGFWSKQLGFYELEMEGGAEQVEDKNGSCRGSMEVLGPVFWPGGARQVPRGWMAISNAGKKTLRIGVPARGAFTQFVKVGFDDQANKSLLVSGFSVDVFKAAMDRLPYHLPYQLIPYYGSYDEMVKHVYLKV